MGEVDYEGGVEPEGLVHTISSGDVLFGKLTRPGAKVALLIGKGLVQPEILVLHARPGTLDARFLRYALLDPRFSLTW